MINWTRVVIDALDERLDIEGFRRPDQALDGDTLWRIWQAAEDATGSEGL